MGVADSLPGSTPLIRRLLVALGGVFALGLSVLYVLPYVTPSAVDRSIIEGLLGRAAGRPVQIAGDASYSLFLRFRVSRPVRPPNSSTSGRLSFLWIPLPSFSTKSRYCR